jgi:TRAP-type C4-dicarboxylate transport system permease small subunit
VDILPALVPKTRFFFQTFGDITMIVFGVLLAVFGIAKLQSLVVSGQVSTAMRIPMWVVYLGLEIGWLLTLLRFIQKYTIMFYNFAKYKKLKNPFEDEKALIVK